MKTNKAITLICCLILLLISFHSVIGETIKSEQSISPSTPLFDHRSQKYQNPIKQNTIEIQYLKKTNHQLNHSQFSLNTSILFSLFQLINEEDSKALTTNKLFNLIKKNLPNDLCITNEQSYEMLFNNENPFNSSIFDRLYLCQDSFSTVFPTCVILVLVTIMLLYAYIIVVDVSNFILLILENLI